MRVERYEAARQAEWDAFVRRSKNGTFLFLRGYMDYHGDRFQDHSLLFYDRDLVALLPGHVDGDIFASHNGLTYGGFVTDERMRAAAMLDLFDATLRYLHDLGIRRFLYKTIPWIYPRLPAEEDRYALFRADARLVRRGAMTVVDVRCRLAFDRRRERGVRKAVRCGLTVSESEDWAAFWAILSERLMEAYGTHPVHSLGEIEQLHGQFPQNIRLFGGFQDNAMVAGVVVYETERVARSQYIAANAMGRQIGALDLVFDHLLNHVYQSKPFFDFGTSDILDGRELNPGLIEQKQGFGGRMVVQDHYEMAVT